VYLELKFWITARRDSVRVDYNFKAVLLRFYN
jgi:hypothetical protein